MVFERIDMFNEEIDAAREEKRKPVLSGDVRGRTRYIGVATQHRDLRRAARVPELPVEAGSQDPVQPRVRGRAGDRDARRAARVGSRPGRSLPGLHRGRPARAALAARAAARVPPRRDLRGIADADVRHRPRRSSRSTSALVQVGGETGLGQAEVEGRRARRRPRRRQRRQVAAHRRCASASAWPRARRGRTPARCSPTSSAQRCTRSTSRTGSASWPKKPGCRSSSSTQPAHRGDAGARGGRRHQDRVRAARPLHDPDHPRPVSARLGCRCTMDSAEKVVELLPEAVRAGSGEPIMTACPHPAPISRACPHRTGRRASR